MGRLLGSLAFQYGPHQPNNVPVSGECLNRCHRRRQGVLSLTGFLNRWNSTFQTELEAPPAAFLASLGEMGAG